MVEINRKKIKKEGDVGIILTPPNKGSFSICDHLANFLPRSRNGVVAHPQWVQDLTDSGNIVLMNCVSLA